MMLRNLISVIYTAFITIRAGKLFINLAYADRGYVAVGGEFLAVILIYILSWTLINRLLDSLEDLKYAGKRKKRRSKRTARI